MTWVTAAIITVGGNLIGSSMQANAARSAANTQSDAARYAADLQQRQLDRINQQNAPYRGMGYNALNQIGALGSGTYQMYDAEGNPTNMGMGSGFLTQQEPAYKPFTAEDLKGNLAPNYQFMLQQGLGANKQNANVGGGGTNMSRGATKFAEDYASNAYQNALNNYMTQQQQGFNQRQTQTGNIFNRLAAIAGIGQASQGQVNTAGQNIASNIGSANMAGAGYQAAGNVGAANAYAGAANSIGNAGYMYGMMNRPGASGSIGPVQNSGGYYDSSQQQF
jgi:hypothetical protein